jgi:hypothetical protein
MNFTARDEWAEAGDETAQQSCVLTGTAIALFKIRSLAGHPRFRKRRSHPATKFINSGTAHPHGPRTFSLERPEQTAVVTGATAPLRKKWKNKKGIDHE